MATEIIVTVNSVTEAVTVAVAEARDAYQLAVAEGYVGTRTEWLAQRGIGGGTADGFTTAPNEDAGLDLLLWNDTQQVYQRLRITGGPGLERLVFIS